MNYIKVSLLVLLLAFAYSTVVPHPGPVVSHIPRTYKVSLDDPI